VGKKRFTSKTYLKVLIVVGLLAVIGGGAGTFATFNAEVTNTGNYFATGTLLLHSTTGATTCTSESATDNLNVGTGDACATLFTVNLTASTAVQYAQLTLKNAGTVNASDIKFESPTPGCVSTAQLLLNTTLSAQITIGSTVNTIPVSSITLAIRSGDTITVTDGVNSQTFTAASAVGVTANPTTIPVTGSPTATSTFANGSDVKTAPSFGNGDLCTGLQVAIIESDPGLTNHVRCAYGFNPGAADCTLDPSKSLSTLPVGIVNLTALNLEPDANGNTSTQLNAGGTRYFLIAVKPPTGGLDNTYQNKKATFSLLWQIDQA
jgi:predicted ribosomally synthesized peptide with SipW-like signal peptide